MRIEWSERATRDLRDVRRYIARNDPRAAKAVALKILEGIERLVEFPASGRPGRLPNTRELIIPGTPFIIPYSVSADVVRILAVIHGARKTPL